MPSLIHIGLHKTGTKSLQNLWSTMPEVSLAFSWLGTLQERLTSAIATNQAFNLDDMADTALYNSRATTSTPFSIYSAEMLSSSPFFESPTADDRADTLFDACAQIMQAIAPDAHILMVLRNPADWIASRYRAYVHIGASQTFRNFTAQKERYLLDALALERPLAGWEKYFDRKNIHVLPFEWFRDAPKDFFQYLQDKTGAPIPNLEQNLHHNPSQSSAELEFMRRFSKISETFLKGNTLDAGAKDLIRKQLPILIRTLRKDLQDDKNILKRAIKQNKLAEIDIGELPAALKAKLRTTHLPALKNWTSDRSDNFFGYYDLYANSIETS